ncbi:MAG: BamA/TamA family outer membrane protein [Rickettsiales bacterium]|jgi:hemolysin activation/secretion protein|nr:BamA/TamA family outer membrane protein [Rickettsiales bacterium]
MRLTIKYALLISLLSSTALAQKNQIANNNIYDQSSIIKNKSVGIVRGKAGKSSRDSSVYTASFKAFVVHEITINFDGIEQQKSIKDICAEYVGKYMTHEMISELKIKLIKSLIQQDYLVPQVNISENKGRLKVSIGVAGIDSVVILGEGKNNQLMKEYADKILSAKTAKVKYVQRYLALMNKIPGYDIEYKLEEKIGDSSKTELIIATVKTKGEAFVGVDNYGVNDLGKMQMAAVGQIYSPFGAPDSFLVHGSTTNHPDRLNDVGFGYSRTINTYGTDAHFFASHFENNSTKDDIVNADSGTGNNVRASLTHHLYLAAHQDLQGEIAVNYRNATSHVVDSITNVSRTDRKSNYISGDAGLKFLFKDGADGRNMMHLSVVQGIDGRFKNYNDGGVLDVIDSPDEHFNIIKFNIYRDQEIANNFSIFSHVSANYSGHKLPSQEKFTLGGRDFGRGYSFGTIDGNRMLAASLEVRYTHQMDGRMFVDEVQPYIFRDMGYVGKQYGDTDITHLSSTGAGLRLKLLYDIDCGAEAAVPVNKSYKVDGEQHDVKTKFGVYINKAFKF